MKKSGLKPIKNREEIIKRDSSRCRRCGRRTDSGHVHHLYGRVRVPAWLKIPDDDPNHEANLVYLCPECHWKVHNAPPDDESQTEIKEWKESMAVMNLRRTKRENRTAETFGR
ncbi:HNH endonuclease [Mesotoga sp. UBA6090]|uniref:HNH endonuclease n=1 Tax=Mesotoga sp. UBA6090 TaxID=1946860 RepID=UPI0025D519E2|nr:HNH endonuclease [Mesotoga sp. UBA6090]